MRVVVGSSDIQLSSALVDLIASLFVSTDMSEAFGIRTAMGSDEPTSPVERLISTVADRLGRRVIRFSPTAGGRAAVFYRDYDLVAEASSVVAFFSPDREMEGGTGHVVKAALDRGIQVDAYTVLPDGSLQYLGSDGPDPAKRGSNDVLERMWREVRDH